MGNRSRRQSQRGKEKEQSRLLRHDQIVAAAARAKLQAEALRMHEKVGPMEMSVESRMKKKGKTH